MKDIKETAKTCCWQGIDVQLLERAESNLKRFSSAFPRHPYNTIIRNTLEGLMKIRVGGRFIDFTGTDVSGKVVSLSDVIKSNKFVLLDFWSTWCAPCIKTSREIISVYNEFKANGFAVVGITQVYGKTEKLVTFIQREKYPWPNLIDIENKSGVWDKYNLSMQGGGTFLINSSGTIIAVNPNAQQVKEKLAELSK